MGSTFFIDLPVFTVKEPPPIPPLSAPAPPLVLETDRIVPVSSDQRKEDDDQCNEQDNIVRPFALSLGNEKSAAEVLDAASTATPSRSRRRMLVVDDSSTNRRDGRHQTIAVMMSLK